MLAPPEAAPAEVHTWDEALAMLRRAPDFLTSVDAVARAVAQRRIALAAVLPTLVGQGSYKHNFNTESIPFGGDDARRAAADRCGTAAITASWNIVNPRGIYGVGTADLAIDVANLSLADRRRVLAARSSPRCSTRSPPAASPSSIASGCAPRSSASC